MQLRTATFPVMTTKSNAQVKDSSEVTAECPISTTLQPTTLLAPPSTCAPPLLRGDSFNGTPVAAKILSLYHQVLACEEKVGDWLAQYLRNINDHRRVVVDQRFLELAHQRLFIAYGGTPSDVDLDPLIQVAKADPLAGHVARISEIQFTQSVGVANFRRALADLVPGIEEHDGSLSSCSDSSSESPTLHSHSITSHPYQSQHDEVDGPPLEPVRHGRRASCAI